MGKASVRYVDSGGRTRRKDVIFDGPDKTFKLGTEKITHNFLEPVENRLLDFMEIAAAVFAADGSIARGGETQPNHGESWRRNLHFDIDVRAPDFWSRPDVKGAMVDFVSFLTDDDVSFDFHADTPSGTIQPYFNFSEEGTEPFQADEVVMYSGGLDSVAGILELLRTTQKRVALVTHRSAPKLITRQKHIVQELRRKFPGRLLWIEVNATRSGQKYQAPESIQRSRSFLFTALGTAVSQMFGAEGLTFFENGVVSQNLPIAGHVARTLATRTTHPLAIRHLTKLASLIAGRSFEIRNPFAWETKTKVVERFITHDATNFIQHTVNCNNVRGRSRNKHHCGSCNQCLDRTFALYATGLQGHDTTADYETDVLFGARNDWRGATIAAEWTRHAVTMANIRDLDFIAEFGAEATRVAEGFPELNAFDAMRRIHDLQRRHGAAVREGLASALQAHASRISNERLERTCLLTMYLTDSGEYVEVTSPSSPRQKLSLERQPERTFEPATAFLPLQVEFVGPQHVKVRYLADVVGDRAEVVTHLKEILDVDREQRLPLEDHRFVRCRDIADVLNRDEPVIRQHVKRVRDLLRNAWCEIHDAPPDGHLLIQTSRGYHLDPTIHEIRGHGAD